MKYWKETVFRAAVLGCVLGGPAAALDFTAAPERIEGVSLGMSLAEVRDLLEDKGFVALSTRTDIETPEGRVFGRIRPFGKPSTMEILQVEIGPDGPLQDKVFRVTAKFPESRLDDATLALLNDRFGDPHCADGTYRFDGDWAPSDAPDCDTTMFIPEGVMSAEIAQRVMADPAPRYSAVIGKLPGDDPLVIVSTQDNRLASALGLAAAADGQPRPEATPDQPAAATPDVPGDAPEVAAATPAPEAATGQAAQPQGIEILGVAPGMALDEARAILEGKGFRLNPVETTRLRLLEGSDARQSVRVPASLGMTGSIGNGVTDAGGIIRISARPDGVIWDVQYDYHYNREGPYGDYEGLLAALEERTLGAVPVRRDWEGGSVSYYFYDPDMTPRTDITCKNCSAYFPSLSDSWEKVNEDEGKTTGGDYAVFHSQVYAGEDRGRKYVTKMAFRSRNMGLIVPYLEALYRGLQSATRTQTKPVDF